MKHLKKHEFLNVWWIDGKSVTRETEVHEDREDAATEIADQGILDYRYTVHIRPDRSSVVIDLSLMAQQIERDYTADEASSRQHDELSRQAMVRR